MVKYNRIAKEAALGNVSKITSNIHILARCLKPQIKQFHLKKINGKIISTIMVDMGGACLLAGKSH